MMALSKKRTPESLRAAVRSGLFAELSDIGYTARLRVYPDGSQDLLVCDKPVFGRRGWERTRERVKRDYGADEDIDPISPVEWSVWEIEDADAIAAERRSDNLARAVRRAKQSIRDICRCNRMSYFVTLTLDQNKVDRYDVKEITRKLNSWLDNCVRRQGLKYVLVPELHKDGALHFHGFFDGALPVEDSGTLSDDGQSPRKPRTAAERRRMLEAGARVIYNLPRWTLGYSTAIELYGEYSQAIGYVCKYISKAANVECGGKIGGRWYYSGGALERSEDYYLDFGSIYDAEQMEGAESFEISRAGLKFISVELGRCPINGTPEKLI